MTGDQRPQSMIRKVTSSLDPRNLDPEAPSTLGWGEKMISPVRPMAFNFRFNQVFAIFPAHINPEYTIFELRPNRILWTFTVKLLFTSVIVALIYISLWDQGYTIRDVVDRFLLNQSFSKTDYFSIVSHFLFLQISANIIFFNNLGICKGLTRLIKLLEEQTIGIPEISNLPPPPAKPLMIYRYSICVMCTIASILLFTSVHSIVRNPKIMFYDYIIITVLAVAVYVENQNHMFSELLYLRFNTMLEKRCASLVEHLNRYHKAGDRNCCIFLANSLWKTFKGINKAFGKDLLVAVFILNISIIFGFYLLVTFAMFISYKHKALFIVTYTLYAVIPSIRLYVLSQASERIRHQMKTILNLLLDLEMELPENAPIPLQKKLKRSRIQFEGFKGFSADGFFHLNRSLMTSVVGTLVTYLIVLLQFKQADTQFQANLFANNLVNFTAEG